MKQIWLGPEEFSPRTEYPRWKRFAAAGLQVEISAGMLPAPRNSMIYEPQYDLGPILVRSRSSSIRADGPGPAMASLILPMTAQAGLLRRAPRSISGLGQPVGPAIEDWWFFRQLAGLRDQGAAALEDADRLSNTIVFNRRYCRFLAPSGSRCSVRRSGAIGSDPRHHPQRFTPRSLPASSPSNAQ